MRGVVGKEEKSVVERPTSATKDVSAYEKGADPVSGLQVCAQIDECFGAMDRMEEVQIVPTIAVGFCLIPPHCRL